jgi:FkbM family methyltransferase
MTREHPRQLLRRLLSRRRFQGLFETLHELALVGMNVGEGTDPSLSGERRVLHEVGQRTSAQRELLVFDVGAHRGDYSVAVREELPQARIEAFEPSSVAFSQLGDRFAGVDAVRIHNVAVAGKTGAAELIAPIAGSKAGSLFDRSARLGYIDVDREVVNVTTLDAFCDEYGIQSIDLLKLDVEGGELDALSGSERLLSEGRIDCIQFEFGAANLQSRTFFRDFYEMLVPNYDLYRVVRDGLHPICRYDERLESFRRATNYVALRRETARS